MHLRRNTLSAAALVVAMAASAKAADTTVGTITIHDPWARASVGAGGGAAFFTISNSGTRDDRLVGAATDIAESTELHTHIKDGDVMRMRQIPAIDIPAGASTTLQPGGLHVMFLGLAAPLEAGTTFPLTLSFANAGKVTVEVEVEDVAAMGPAGSSGHDHTGAPGGMDDHQGMRHGPD